MRDVILHVQDPPPGGGYLLTGEEVVSLAWSLLNVAVGGEMWYAHQMEDGNMLAVSRNEERCTSQARLAVYGGKP